MTFTPGNLSKQYFCKIKMLVDNNIAARNTASKYLDRLTELGILESVKEGKETLYLNRGLFEILSSG